MQTFDLNQTQAQKWSFSEASPVAEGLYAISSSLGRGKVLDIKNGSISNGTNLQLYDSNGTSAQMFRVSVLGSGWYRIVCLGSNKSLDVVDGKISPTEGLGYVQQWDGNAGAAQKWKFEYAGGGFVSIVSACGEGSSCLDVFGAQTVNGTAVGVYRRNGSLAQKFKMQEIGSVAYISYSISLPSLFEYQRTGNSHIADVSDSELYQALDPSNSVGAAFYQFADLRINTGLSGSQLDRYIKRHGSGGVLEGKGSVFAAAASLSRLNEAYLAAHTCLESGWGKSQLAKGSYYDGKGYWYTGKDGKQYWAALAGYKAGTYYNLFGIGAYDADPHKYGVEAAIRNGWNSVDSAVYGAAEWIAKNYVYASSYPQVTLYNMKWDTTRSDASKKYGWHQYATDVQWAKKTARLMGDCYSSAGVLNPDVVYRVPSYA